MRSIVCFLSISIFCFASCTIEYCDPNISPLQVREAQTRHFEHCNVKMMMKALLNVFQDDGYMVRSASSEIGLLTAERVVDIERGRCHFFVQQDERWDKLNVIDVTANITEFGDGVRVRLSFVTKIIDNCGAITETRPIVDDTYYQEFFVKVSKGIFYQSEDL